MARRYGRSSSKQNDKYLRLTGLWPSKHNDALFTGRVKADDVEALIEKFQEALDGGAPIVFSLWENDKKESRKDPDFSLQCFVGDAEEKPRSSRRDRDEDDEKPSRKSKRAEPEDDEEKDDEEKDDEEEVDTEDGEDDEPEEKPRKKSTRTAKPAGKTSKSKNDW